MNSLIFLIGLHEILLITNHTLRVGLNFAFDVYKNLIGLPYNKRPTPTLINNKRRFG